MRRTILTLAASMLAAMALAATPVWSPVKGRIATPWAEKVDPSSPLPEYPRPQMERTGNWINLNGLWDYAIKDVEEAAPAKWDGKILVPFAVESSLSGVGKTVGKNNNLWYRTTFTLPKQPAGQRTLLHFGGVDWRTEVFVNGKSAGTHEGGNDPFCFDITDLVGKGAQQLTVKVWDPTDEGPQPRGKQVSAPRGIWYTPVTGIWQTVWLETVPQTYVRSYKQTPDIDRGVLTVSVDAVGAQPGDVVSITAWEGATRVAETQAAPGQQAELKIAGAKLWSPASPFLYDLRIAVERKGKTVDEVKGYFAMRKIAVAPDAAGIRRMLLNNEFLFQYGPLDQGWWPDGLYTAPTDEALLFDIVKTKEMGFNMIRKHIKVEPARWYWYCDRMGMLVWQDMPSGDLGGTEWQSKPGLLSPTRGQDKVRSAESEAIYRKEWKAIMSALHNFPSIVVWVPFNEAWGQFKTVEITEWTMQNDPSRLVNSASGGSFFPTGQIIDLHNYPEPSMPRPDLFGARQVIVLGEFGGLGLPLEGHTWQGKDNWGYQSFKTAADMLKVYSGYMNDLQWLIDRGLSAAVYTQTTDVEVETNGLMTYDRKVVKFPETQMKQMHDKLYAVPVKIK